MAHQGTRKSGRPRPGSPGASSLLGEMVSLCCELGGLLAEAKFRGIRQSQRAQMVREGFSEEGELEPVLKMEKN